MLQQLFNSVMEQACVYDGEQGYVLLDGDKAPNGTPCNAQWMDARQSLTCQSLLLGQTATTALFASQPLVLCVGPLPIHAIIEPLHGCGTQQEGSLCAQFRRYTAGA